MEIQGQENFSHYLSRVQERSHTLSSSVGGVSWEHPELVMECLQELQNALEELRVAEEELRQQNEQLLETQQAVEAERQRYRELFEFAPDGYIVSDMYGVVQEANQIAARLLNINQSHLIGKPMISFVAEAQRRPFRQMLAQLLTINRVQEWELCFVGRDNQELDVAVTVETVRDSKGRPVALRWLVRDITARKQAEEQLRQIQLQNLELLEADRLKSNFIATVSHELRTPMNAILGFSELLLRRFHQQQEMQLASMVERIFRNGKHLLLLIEEMLDFSRIQSRRLDLRPETFNLVELIQFTVDELQSLAEHKGLELQAKLYRPELVLYTDRSRLRQVLVNLISNAIKFTEQGSVEVEVLELPEGRVVISVHDTGIGIDPADQRYIFQEFWQVNQSSIRPYGGTGLGLAISKALVELMQGSISLESQPGKGSTFRVELPYQLRNGN